MHCVDEDEQESRVPSAHHVLGNVGYYGWMRQAPAVLANCSIDTGTGQKEIEQACDHGSLHCA